MTPSLAVDVALSEEEMAVAAYELVLLVTRVSGTVDAEAEESLDTIRVRLGLSRGKHKTLLERFAAAADADSSVPGWSVVFRYEAMRASRPREAESKEFLGWLTRQFELFQAGLVGVLRSLDVREVVLGDERRERLDDMPRVMRRAFDDVVRGARNVYAQGHDAFVASFAALDAILRHVLAQLKDVSKGKYSRTYMPLPVPLAVRLYIPLLDTLYDHDDDVGNLVVDHEVIRKAYLDPVKSKLALSDLVDAVCLVTALFAKYKSSKHVNLALSIKIQLSKIAGQSRRALAKDAYATALTEQAIAEILAYASGFLTDVRSNFGESEVVSLEDLETAGNFSSDNMLALLELYFDALEKSAAGTQVNEHAEVERFILGSCAKTYARAVSVSGSTATLENLTALIVRLEADIELEARLFYPAFAPYHQHAQALASGEYLRLFGDDYLACLDTSPPESTPFPGVTTVLGTLSKLEPRLRKAGKTIARVLFEASKPYVLRWLEARHERYMAILETCIAGETWAPVSDAHRYSASVVDLFFVFSQTVPEILSFRVPETRDYVASVAKSIDAVVRKYAARMLALTSGYEIDAPALVPGRSPSAAAPPGSSRFNRLATMVRRRLTVGSGAQATPAAETGAEADAGTEPLACVITRFNNLVAVPPKIRGLQGELEHHLRKIGVSDHGPLDVLQSTIESVEASAAAVGQALAKRVVYRDLRAVFLDGLYTYPVAEHRMSAVIEQLDTLMHGVMEQVTSEGDADVASTVIGGILEAAVDVLLRVLLDGGPERDFSDPHVTAILLQDLDELREFFMARDEETGECDGLDEDVVNGASAFHWELLMHVMPRSSQQLIDAYASAPATSASEPLAKNVIFRVLLHRYSDRVAQRFIETAFRNVDVPARPVREGQ